MGKVDTETGKPDIKAFRAFQRLWALGADLGHTNSTSAFLLGASILSGPLSCLISALSSGYVILHISAAEASLKSLALIISKNKVTDLIDDIKKAKPSCTAPPIECLRRSILESVSVHRLRVTLSQIIQWWKSQWRLIVLQVKTITFAPATSSPMRICSSV